jgi:hypothetical protein
MVASLKHYAVRIWLAAVGGGLLSLIFLPAFQLRFGLEYLLLPVTLLMLAFFVVIGWALNSWGLGTVERCIHEARAYERDGMIRDAESAYRRAVAVFDSFMLSPFARRMKARALSGRLARFYLARADRSTEAEQFLMSYIHAHPQDREVAESWLAYVQRHGGLREEHQDLAVRIGEAHPRNLKIQRILARYYLVLERTDYAALQSYRCILKSDRQNEQTFIHDLAQLFLRERRADEWALRIYLRAHEAGTRPSPFQNGIAACLQWLQPTDQNSALLQKARQALSGIDASQWKNMGAGFQRPIPPAPQPKPRRIKMPLISFDGALRWTHKHFVTTPAAFMHWIFGQLAEGFQFLRRSRKARRRLAAGLVGGLMALMTILLINTLMHLMPEEKSAAVSTPAEKKVVTDPFTLQVAAYLKPEHAERYVAELRNAGLDVYWTQAVRGDKSWFQVRVSHFADKNSARQYGEALKAKGLIDDYYVANYKPPE